MAIVALTEAVYYILLSLDEPLHGYGIMQKIEELTQGRLSIAAGTLYGALSTLEEREWIIALPEDKDSRRKSYQITEEGRNILKDEILRLQELLRNGEKVLGASK